MILTRVSPSTQTRTYAVVLALSLFCTIANAADIIKDNNTTALNVGSSWVGGTGPGSGDVAVWNNTVTAANTTVLGANTSWQGIKIVNPTGLVTINTGSTLTLGSSGIDIASTNAGISIRTAVTLGAAQSFVIGNGTTAQDLLFDSASSGLAFNMGGFTVGTSGLGTMRFTSGHTISNGTFNLDNANSEFQSGSSRTMTLNSDVTLNLAAGKQLTFAINSAPGSGLGVSSAAAININGGTLQINSSGAAGTNRMEQTGKVSFSGTSTVNNASAFGYFTNFSGEIALAGTTTWNSSGSSTANTTISGPLTGSGTLNYRGTTANHRTLLSGDNSGFSGTINLDGGSGLRTLRLTTATAGSASATWAPAAGNILQVDGVAVNLGILNGAGTVTNSHATNVAAISVGSGAFSGAITNGTPTNGMSLTKVGAGTLTLSGNGNTFTGNTLISGGKLVATQTGALSTSSAISVNGGGAIFDGTGTFGAVTVADGLGTVQNGNGTSGVLTLSSLTFDGDATLNIVTSSSTPTARVVVTGALTTTAANGQVTVNGSGSWTNGTNNLVNFGSFGGALSDFMLGTLTGLTARQSAGSLSLSGSALSVTVTGDSPKWTGLDSSSWAVGATGASGNWKLITGGGQTDFIANDIVLFDDTAAGTKTVDVSAANISVASAEFNNSSSNYTLTSSGGFGITAGTLTKNGTGTLTIENANTTSGSVLLNAGTLNVNHAGALGSGAITIAAVTTLNNTSGSVVTATNAQNWNGDFTFTGSNDLTLGTAAMNASRQVTITAGTLSVGGITGTGFGLTKEGAGTLAVGASTYTGATTINAGTLKATSTTSFTTTSSVTLVNAAGVALDLNGNNQTISTLSGGGSTGGDILLNGAVLTTGAAANTTFAGDLVGAGGLTKTGAGIFTLTGDKSGYTGSTNVSAGTLDLGTINGHFGPTVTVTAGAANNSIIVGGGLFVQGNGTLNTGISGGSAGFGARGGNLTVNVGGAGAMINRNSAGNGGLGQMIFGSATSDSKVIVQNEIGLNNNGGTRDITVHAGTGTASAEISGVISGGGAGGISGIVKQGAGSLILSAANTYSGPTTINAGRIVIGHAQALQFSALNTASAGKVTATGFATPTLGGLTGSTDLATVIDTGYADITTLTLNPQGTQSQTYSGVIADGAVGMNLTKSGTGTQVLSGINTYTGTTNLNAGTLTLGHAIDTLFNTSSINVAGGTLALGANNDTVAAVTLASGSISGTGGTLTASSFDVRSGNVSAMLGGTGALTKSTAGTVILTGDNTYSGGTTISAGTLEVNNTSGSGTGSGSVTVTSTLKGDGSITASSGNSVIVNGAMILGATGATAGTDFSLTTSGAGSTIFGATSLLSLDLWSSTGIDQTGILAAADMLRLFGTLDIISGAQLKLSNPNALTFQVGDMFRLIDWTALTTRTGTFTEDFAGITLSPGLSIDSSAFYTLGTISIVAIPEPSRALLLMIGLAGLIARRRR